MNKQLLTLFLLLVLGCSGKEKAPPNGEPYNQSEATKVKIARDELQSAVILVEANDPEGLLRLYEIYVNESLYGVEFCEIAKEKLDHFLYLKTDLWIATFSKKDQRVFRWKGISAIQMPQGIRENEFEQLTLDKLRKFRGTKEEMRFVAHLIAMIDSLPN